MDTQKTKKVVAKKPVAKKSSVKLANDAQTSPYSNTGFLYSGSGVGKKAQKGMSVPKSPAAKKLVNTGAKTKNLLNPKKFASRTMVAKSGAKMSKGKKC